MAEISFVKSSDACKANRIDSEYYRKTVLDKINAVKKHDNENLSELADFIIGPFGSTVKVEQYVDESEYRYVRNQDVNDFVIKDDTPIFLPKDVYDSLPRYHIQENDLIMTVLGTLGKVSIATEKDTKSIFSCKNTLIRPKSINPFYLLTYLNTETGKILSIRGKRGVAQEFLNLTDLKEINIFIPSPDFQLKIEKVVKSSFQISEKSKKEIQNAQTLLLEEIGLSNWKPKRQLAFIKKQSDIIEAERIDAEYFQPKYDEIIHAIEKYNEGCTTIGNEFKQNKSRVNIDKKKLYEYVEIGSVNVSNAEIIPKEVFGKDLPANAKRVLKKDDVIISKVRTYRGAVAIIEEEGYVGSGAFTILEENGRINKETLFAFLHSKPLLALSLKPNTGTSYPVILDEDILSLPIPLIDEIKQQNIKEQINEAIFCRKKSKLLLEIAKKTVEIAIEKNEKEALKWLDSQGI